MKIVQQSLIWPATYVHLFHERYSLFNRQGDITLMEISLLIFYEKRQPLNPDYPRNEPSYCFSVWISCTYQNKTLQYST